MKVLYVASEFASGMIPFATKIVNTISKDKRFDVQCVCTNSCNKRYKSFYPSIKVTNVEYPTSKFGKLIYKFWPIQVIKSILSIINMEQPDIVHFLTGDFTLAFFCIFYKGKNSFVYTVHDLTPHEVYNKRFMDKIMHHMIINGYLICRKEIPSLVTSSKVQFNILHNLYKRKKIGYIPFPSLVTDEIIRGTNTLSEIVGLKHYLLFFGSVNKYKGVELLVKAYKKSILYGKKKLVIAGVGDVHYKSDNNIIRINRFIQDSEIKALFEKADVVVYPYLSATMSGVLSIAYYFNKVTVLSDVPFFLDNPSDVCHFFKAGNEADLVRVLNEIKGIECLCSAKTAYTKLYSGNTMANAYYDFYQRILYKSK